MSSRTKAIARQAHNMKVTGSNPVPATTFIITHSPSRYDSRRRVFPREGAINSAWLGSALAKDGRVPCRAVFSSIHVEVRP
jgi:hypothetical protein